MVSVNQSSVANWIIGFHFKTMGCITIVDPKMTKMHMESCNILLSKYSSRLLMYRRRTACRVNESLTQKGCKIAQI